MIIYNETYIVNDKLEAEWLQWMKTTHLPAVMATGCYDAYKILTVIDSPNEGVTYCIQYQTDTFERHLNFFVESFPSFQSLHHQQFENEFVMFNTVMEEVE